MPQAFGIENKALNNVVRANVKSTYRIFVLMVFFLEGIVNVARSREI